MCWSEEASYLSFVVGSVTNMAVVAYCCKNHHADAIPPLLWWQFGLFMQVPEAMEWRDIRTGRTRQMPRRLAFWLNVLQPVVACAATIVVTKRHDILSYMALAAYAASFCTGNIGATIRPTEQCKHIRLDWWPTHRAVLYNLATLASIRRLPSFWLNALIFEGTLLFSILFVKPCAIASVWCWSTFIAALCYMVHFWTSQTKGGLTDRRPRAGSSGPPA